MNWDKYQSKVTTERQNHYLDYLIDLSFQGVIGLFALSFEDNAVRTGHNIFSFKSRNKRLQCYDWWKTFFQSTSKKWFKNLEHQKNVATGQGDDYTTVCLLDYPYFTEHCKMIAIDLSKQRVLHAEPKAIQQTNFTGNLDQPGNATMCFIIVEAKKAFFFHKELWEYYKFFLF